VSAANLSVFSRGETLDQHYSSLQVKVAAGPTAILGLWQIAAPFVLGYSTLFRPLVNDVIVGTLVVVLAATCYFDLVEVSWLGWVTAVLGIWLVLAPFVLGYWMIEPATENDVVIGTLIAVLGAWSALAVSSHHSAGRRSDQS